MLLGVSAAEAWPIWTTRANRDLRIGETTLVTTFSTGRERTGARAWADETVHPTGLLKHRLARSLFRYGLCNGWTLGDTTIVEASSGSAAGSEAYIAGFHGLPFIAVMPASTSHEKVALIEAQGGSCRLVHDPTTVYDEAQRLAAETGGCYLDQFTFAERAADWSGNDAIAAVEQVPIRGSRRIRVGLAGPGKAFAYEGLIDGGPSRVTAVTRERALLLVLPRNRFAQVFHGEDAVSRVFLDVIQRELVATLRQTRARMPGWRRASSPCGEGGHSCGRSSEASSRWRRS